MALNGSNFDNGIVKPKLIETAREFVESQSKTQQLTLAAWLELVGRSLINLTTLSPRIWKRSDRMGRIWWYVYNPVSGLSTRLSSEAQLRACPLP